MSETPLAEKHLVFSLVHITEESGEILYTRIMSIPVEQVDRVWVVSLANLHRKALHSALRKPINVHIHLNDIFNIRNISQLNWIVQLIKMTDIKEIVVMGGFLWILPDRVQH